MNNKLEDLNRVYQVVPLPPGEKASLQIIEETGIKWSHIVYGCLFELKARGYIKSRREETAPDGDRGGAARYWYTRTGKRWLITTGSSNPTPNGLQPQPA